MEPTQAFDPALLSHYEGLVRKTSSLCLSGADKVRGKDYEDICQIFRLKVWQALRAWDPSHPKIVKRRRKGEKIEDLRDAFIFGAVMNQKKDLYKRNPQQPLLIEDIAPEGEATERYKFEQRYFQVDHEKIFEGVDGNPPLVPNTLTSDERLVLACLYQGYNGPRTAERLDLTRSQVAAAVRGIREKMKDWKPDGDAAQLPEPSDVRPAPALQGCR